MISKGCLPFLKTTKTIILVNLKAMKSQLINQGKMAKKKRGKRNGIKKENIKKTRKTRRRKTKSITSQELLINYQIWSQNFQTKVTRHSKVEKKNLWLETREDESSLRTLTLKLTKIQTKSLKSMTIPKMK